MHLTLNMLNKFEIESSLMIKQDKAVNTQNSHLCKYINKLVHVNQKKKALYKNEMKVYNPKEY